jgi:hypothetical protein
MSDATPAASQPAITSWLSGALEMLIQLEAREGESSDALAPMLRQRHTESPAALAEKVSA